MKLRRGPALVFFLVAGAAHADSWLPEQAAVRHVTLLGGSGFSRLIATQASIGLDLDRLNRDQLLLEKRRLEDDLPGLGVLYKPTDCEDQGAA